MHKKFLSNFFKSKYLIGKFNLGNYFKETLADIPKKYQNKKIRNLRLIKNLITLPAITPTNDPKAGFIESLKGFFIQTFHLINAPKKGPIIMPIGPKNN